MPENKDKKEPEKQHEPQNDSTIEGVGRGDKHLNEANNSALIASVAPQIIDKPEAIKVVEIAGRWNFTTLVTVTIITSVFSLIGGLLIGKSSNNEKPSPDNPCVYNNCYSNYPPADSTVLFIGSGTVERLFRQRKVKNIENENKTPTVDSNNQNSTIRPRYLYDLLRSKQFKAEFLQGETDSGYKMFLSNPHNKEIQFLLMASKRLNFPDRRAVFEIFLGFDDLQLTLIAKDKPTLLSELKNFPTLSALEEIPQDGIPLKLKDVIENDLWNKSDFIFLAGEGGGTNYEWKENISNINANRWNPTNYKTFDIQNYNSSFQINSPILYLGSKILCENIKKQNPLAEHFKINVVDTEGNPIRRSLYLYGYIGDSSTDNDLGVKASEIPINTSIILFTILNNLKTIINDPNSSLAKCYQKQIEDFGFNLSKKGHVDSEMKLINNVYFTSDCSIPTLDKVKIKETD